MFLFLSLKFHQLRDSLFTNFGVDIFIINKCVQSEFFNVRPVRLYFFLFENVFNFFPVSKLGHRFYTNLYYAFVQLVES